MISQAFETTRAARDRALSGASLTPDLAGIGGVIKERPEDFMVDEQPAFEPTGEGEHICLYVEKRGMATMDLVRLLARHFRVGRVAVGFAGMKDKRAVTRQVVTVHTPGRTFEDFPAIEDDRVRIEWADMHAKKLKRGQLKGNRFSIRIRRVSPTAVVGADRIMRRLVAQGIPNRLGEQRFGAHQNNHIIGRLDLLGRFREAVEELLGPKDGSEADAEARQAFAEGDLTRALELLPGSCRAEAQALRGLIDGLSPEAALDRVDGTQRRFWVTAFQSALFNAIVDDRLRAGTFDRLVAGDIAWRHGSGERFEVGGTPCEGDELAEDVKRLRVSATGPLWGPKMQRAGGEVDRAEIERLRETGVSLEDFEQWEIRTGEEARGARRPIRVPILDPLVEGGVDEHGSYVRVAFELPAGSFATVALREIMKPEEQSE